VTPGATAVVGDHGVAISFPKAEAEADYGGSAISIPAASSQAGVGGIAIAAGSASSVAGLNPLPENAQQQQDDRSQIDGDKNEAGFISAKVLSLQLSLSFFPFRALFRALLSSEFHFLKSDLSLLPLVECIFHGSFPWEHPFVAPAPVDLLRHRPTHPRRNLIDAHQRCF